MFGNCFWIFSASQTSILKVCKTISEDWDKVLARNVSVFLNVKLSNRQTVTDDKPIFSDSDIYCDVSPWFLHFLHSQQIISEHIVQFSMLLLWSKISLPKKMSERIWIFFFSIFYLHLLGVATKQKQILILTALCRIDSFKSVEQFIQTCCVKNAGFFFFFQNSNWKCVAICIFLGANCSCSYNFLLSIFHF